MTRSLTEPPVSDPERWVELYGDYLFRYAMTRLRDPAQAEDAVQETFLAALKADKRFAGRSAERTWLAGILKNKVCDYYRRASRETPFADLEFYADEESGRFVGAGAQEGAWIRGLGPRPWPTPAESLENKGFWQAYRDCSERLPKRTAAVFNLREVDNLGSEEICLMLKISESNLWVMLHRARMALRQCLETHWFGKAGEPL
jgi:RNA polymerase sigma-70 factor (ECF subfamily)